MVADAEVDRRTEAIPGWKRDEVDEIVTFIESFESIGVVDIAGIPSRQLQDMRRELHGTAAVRVSRNTLLVRGLEHVDEGLEELIPYLTGQVGLVGTDDNPFGLFRHLEASKTPAPINAGEIAPNDIVIPAGDTGIDPGPFVGDLQQVGADARIAEGSIAVTADSTVLAAGEEVSEQLANVLSELEMEPKEVGLDLRAVYADGVLFEPDELAIDIDAYRADVRAAASAGRNLAINAGFPTAATVGALIAKATGAAKSVGLSAAIEDPELVPDLLTRADAQLRQLVALIDDEEALPPELRELAPETAAPAAEEAAEEPTDEADAEDAAAEAAEDAGDEDDEDDDDAGAEGLGQMFG